MPKTSIDKNDDASVAEYEIRFAGKFLISPPAGDFVQFKQADEPQLCCRISLAADLPHNARSFAAAKHVHNALVMLNEALDKIRCASAFRKLGKAPNPGGLIPPIQQELPSRRPAARGDLTEM